MRKALVALLSVCLLAFFVGSVSARDAVQNGLRITRDAGDLELDRGLSELYSAAAVDTYCIVWYNFEPADWQGFTTQDMTAQVDTWFHADDFAGLAGGTYGLLYPLEGSISIWCGARPGTDPYLCGWYYAPGYGNNWNQMMVSDPISFLGKLYISYHGMFDSEYDYDFTHVEYDLGNDNWVNVVSWARLSDNSPVDTIATHEILTTKQETKLRFHFTSDGAWSDEDGRGNTDGACIIDSITVWYDPGVPVQVDYEDFEGWTVGATDMGLASMWHCMPEEPYGSYIGLMSNLQDKDPCGDNYGTQIVFFIGSTNPSASYPGLFDTPFCQGPGGITAPCQYEIAISPPIDMTKYSTGENHIQDADIPTEDLDDLGGALLRFTVYRDLPSANNVFYIWHVRNLDPVTLCPSVWLDRNYVYYGPDMDYIFSTEDISLFVGADPIQVALGCIDYCEAFYENPGDCLYHTPSPWIDNIRVYRYKTAGPQWNYRALETFQDNFPENDFNINSSWVRADAADDKAAGTDPYFIPGDSVNVTCTSPLGGGIRENGHGGEVYLHVAVRDVWPGRPGGPKPNLYGPTLEGTYGVYVSDDGSEWTIIQCDTAKTQHTNPIPDQWCVDLNDSLLTRGYEVEYYFKAYDVAGNSSTLPRYAEEGYTWEFTCLPTGRSDVLYVDDFHARGTRIGLVQQYWNPTFEAVIAPENQPDVYDMNAPTSMVGNGMASRATLNHLLYNDVEYTGYRIIIWDSGDLDVATIGDGNPTYEKADDCTLLINWLNQSSNDVGLLVCGDDIAYDLNENLGSTQAIQLMSSWCGVSYVEDSYFELTGGREAGGVITPLITPAVGGIFNGLPSFYAFGGCPIVNGFDVLATTQYGQEALMYPDYEGDSYVAGIQSEQDNSTLHKARTVWLGFSFMYVRDADVSSPIMRNVLFNEIYEWFQGTPNPDITPADVPAMYRLAQNFPNPFNPTTRIAFDIPKKGHVSLKIYNVAGQLVKTLVDDVLEAKHHEYEWTGTNNAGVKVASGVYFYSIEADNFTSTKKMVLLR